MKKYLIYLLIMVAILLGIVLVLMGLGAAYGVCFRTVLCGFIILVLFSGLAYKVLTYVLPSLDGAMDEVADKDFRDDE